MDARLDFFETEDLPFCTDSHPPQVPDIPIYLASRREGLVDKVLYKFELRRRTGVLAGSLGIQSYYLLVAEGRELPLFDPFSSDEVFIPRLAMATAIETTSTLTYNRF